MGTNREAAGTLDWVLNKPGHTQVAEAREWREGKEQLRKAVTGGLCRWEAEVEVLSEEIEGLGGSEAGASADAELSSEEGVSTEGEGGGRSTFSPDGAMQYDHGESTAERCQ